jgi:hypothetical protein
VKNISVYFGVRFEECYNFGEGLSKVQGARKRRELRKKRMLTKTSFNLLYNFGENNLIVGSNNIEVNFEDIFMYEVQNFIKYLTTHLNDKPALRPGEGEVRVIKVGDYP